MAVATNGNIVLRVQKTRVFLKKSPTKWVFWGGFGVLLGFLDKQEKIGKIIPKLSKLKP